MFLNISAENCGFESLTIHTSRRIRWIQLATFCNHLLSFTDPIAGTNIADHWRQIGHLPVGQPIG
jgi:hypothetical protein